MAAAMAAEQKILAYPPLAGGGKGKGKDKSKGKGQQFAAAGAGMAINSNSSPQTPQDPPRPFQGKSCTLELQWLHDQYMPASHQQLQQHQQQQL